MSRSGVGSLSEGHALLPAIEPAVEGEEQREQDRHRESRLGQQMRRGPEEIHPAQEAEEERRVAQRRQRAADVRDQEDEEHHDMDVVAPVVVGAQHRADHDDRGAGRADEARHQRADRQQGGVRRGRAVQVAHDQDAAGDREQREEQDDERDVFEQCGMRERAQRRLRAAEQDQRHEHESRPESRELAVVQLPEMRKQDRAERDREQHAGEGQGPEAAHRGAADAAGGQGDAGSQTERHDHGSPRQTGFRCHSPPHSSRGCRDLPQGTVIRWLWHPQPRSPAASRHYAAVHSGRIIFSAWRSAAADSDTEHVPFPCLFRRSGLPRGPRRRTLPFADPSVAACGRGQDRHEWRWFRCRLVWRQAGARPVSRGSTRLVG